MNRFIVTPVREWQEHFCSGDFDKLDNKTQITAGWYNWSCRDSSLVGKTKKLGQIIKQIKDGGKINLDTEWIWFKNSCAFKGSGSFYDEINFANIKTGNCLLTIQINCCWNKSRYTVFGERFVNDDYNFDIPLFESNSSEELVKWLNTPWEE